MIAMLAEADPRKPAPAADEFANQPCRRRLLGKLAATVSLGLCAAAWAAYGTRIDAVAAVTVCPPWAWALVGLGVVGLAVMLRVGRWTAIVTVLAWTAYLAGTADTPAALFRTAPPRADNARLLEP